MHSAKTDPPTSPRRWSTGSARGLTQRLNVRLVIALASVALVALLVSAATLNQILPGLFVSQAEVRAAAAAQATALFMEDNVSHIPPDVLATPELRNTQFLLVVARIAADSLAQGT